MAQDLVELVEQLVLQVGLQAVQEVLVVAQEEQGVS